MNDLFRKNSTCIENAFSFESIHLSKKHRFEIPQKHWTGFILGSLEADIGITNVSFGVLAMMRGKFLSANWV